MFKSEEEKNICKIAVTDIIKQIFLKIGELELLDQNNVIEDEIEWFVKI